MPEFFDLFSVNGFIPEGNCYLWYPDILWLHVISDIAIAFSLLSILLIILYVARRSVPFLHRGIFLLFIALIFLFSLTHLLNVVIVWYPIYRFEAIIKALTAGVSLAMTIMVLPLIQRALKIYYRYGGKESDSPQSGDAMKNHD